jgi:hypothetical protein
MNSTDSNGLAIDVAAEFAGALDTLRHNPAISKNPPDGEPPIDQMDTTTFACLGTGSPDGALPMPSRPLPAAMASRVGRTLKPRSRP